VALKRRVTQTLLGAAILVTALLAVGLTASAESLFSIRIHPVFLRVDPSATAEARARLLGVDVDVRIGETHLHFGWSAVPIPSSTKSDASVF
jgi:hypothetical protein